MSNFKEFHTSYYPGNINELKEFIEADSYLAPKTIKEGVPGDSEAESMVYLPKAVSIVLMNKGQIQELLSIIDDNQGNIPVYFKVGANGEKCKSKVNIDLNYSTLAKLQGKFGSGVKIHYNT